MTQELGSADWAETLAAGIAREVRRHRQAKGWSAQQLADKTAEQGLPIQRSVIANLESGRRTTVNVAEVLILARALEVPPGALIFPVGHAQHVEYLPGCVAEPMWAFEWLTGRAFPSQEATDAFPQTAVGMVRRHGELMTALMKALRTRDSAADTFAQAVEMYGDAAERHRQALEQLRYLSAQLDEEEGGSGRHVELFKQHSQQFEITDKYVADARRYRYAEERLRSIEREVADLETALVAVRKEMRQQGLVPPLLFRRLVGLDSEATVALDDAEARRELIRSEFSEAAPTAFQGAGPSAGDDSPLPVDADALQMAMPFIKEAVKEALREWHQDK
jgi:transcriptional regulator with XRE-family HTH domain